MGNKKNSENKPTQNIYKSIPGMVRKRYDTDPQFRTHGIKHIVRRDPVVARHILAISAQIEQDIQDGKPIKEGLEEMAIFMRRVDELYMTLADKRYALFETDTDVLPPRPRT